MASGPGGRVRDDALEQGPGPSGGARGLVVGGGEDLRGGPARGQDASVEDLLQGRGEEPGEKGFFTMDAAWFDAQDFAYELTEDVHPVYRELKGWQCDTTKLTDPNDFPQALKDYIAFVEGEIGVPISIVSVGPDREQTIALHPELLPQTH